MSAGERVVNTGAGAVRDGLKWGVVGMIATFALITLGFAALGLGLGALIGGGWALGGAVLFGLGGMIPAYFASKPVGILGAGMGVIKGGASGFLRRTSDTQTVKQQLAEAQQQSVVLQQQMDARRAELAQAAGGFNNLDATTGHVERQAATLQQQTPMRPPVG